MRFRTVAAAALAVISLAAAGCSSGDDGGGNQITVWSLENEADRMQATKKIVDKFSAKTGIKVKLVGVEEDQFQQLITSNAAGGELPDVVGALPLASVQSLAVNDLVDTEAVKATLDGLGQNTFDQRALELTKYEGKQVAVPSDAWAQLLIYRKDLFEKAGLDKPDSFDKLKAAAEKLNSGGTAGITMATTPGDAFTEQSFEFLALANGCQLVDNAGKATLTSPQCVETFQLYTDLITKSSVKGNQDVDSVRATYFSGKAAIALWSTFILDEMAGLRSDALPTCPECKDDPAFLAKNSDFVTTLQGPSGTKPTAFGEITSWSITQGENPDGAKKFVTFMADEGYTEWLGFAPEGKFPTRKGTAAEPKKFLDAWGDLQAGVDKKAPLSKFYSPEVLAAMRDTPGVMDRWGLPQGQGKLLGATLGELPVPKAIGAAVNGEASPPEAAAQAQKAVEQIQKTLR